MNKLYLAIMLSVFLTGCETTRSPLGPAAIQAAIQTELDSSVTKKSTLVVPDDVNAELLPELENSHELNLPTVEPRVNISAKGVRARAFFGSLLKGSKYNLTVNPDVSGRITLVLNDVTISDVMDAVADMYGYDIQLQGNTYRINGAGLRTEIIPMNYLLMKRNGFSNSSISSGYLSDSNDSANNNDNSDDNFSDNKTQTTGQNSTQISTWTDTDYWVELKHTLLALTTDTKNTQVIISPQAGLVTVLGYPNDIRRIKDFLRQAETQLQRQVLLEVKIMEVTLNDGYEQGVNWNVNNGKEATDNSFSFGIDNVTNIANIADLTSKGSVLTLASGSFSAAISLLKTQGDVNVLSSPRVTALNNQKAVIKVGSDEYFVTGYNSTSSTENKTVDQNVELTPFFSGIALDVTPQIDSKGGVLLHVHPTIIDVTDSVKTIKAAQDIVLPMAKSDVRETDTVVKAQSGEIIVIGGLMKTANKDRVSKVPFLGDIPWLGELFTYRSQSVQKTELIILIKPVVVNQNTWRLELERSAKLLEQWYPTEQQDEKG